MLNSPVRYFVFSLAAEPVETMFPAAGPLQAELLAPFTRLYQAKRGRYLSTFFPQAVRPLLNRAGTSRKH